jgi:hypothetical protein
MKTINYGAVNDSKVFAVWANERLVPLTKEDLEFQSADVCINCDSGDHE